MRPLHRSIACAAALVLAVATADHAEASRPTCDELLEALDNGRPQEDVAADYGTTQARLEACLRIAQQRERFAEQRNLFQQDRNDRGLTP